MSEFIRGCSVRRIACAALAAGMWGACLSADISDQPLDVHSPTATAAEGGSSAAYCQAACAYRSDSLGCGGDPNTCAAFCLAVHNVASQQGRCAAQATALEDCRYSTEALDLGCTVRDSVIDMRVCAKESSAVDSCKAMRDAPRTTRAPLGTLPANSMKRVENSGRNHLWMQDRT